METPTLELSPTQQHVFNAAIILGFAFVLFTLIGLYQGNASAKPVFNPFNQKMVAKDLVYHVYANEGRLPSFFASHTVRLFSISLAIFLAVMIAGLVLPARPVMFKPYLLLYLIFLLGAIDLVTKTWAYETLKYGYSRPFFMNVLYFTYRENTGAAFSVFEGQTDLLAIMSVVAIAVVLFFYLTSPKSIFMDSAFVLILSGATGNLYDRARFNYVRDFLDLRGPSGQNIWPVFNLADMFIVCGAILIFLATLLEIREERRKEREEKEKKKKDQGKKEDGEMDSDSSDKEGSGEGAGERESDMTDEKENTDGKTD